MSAGSKQFYGWKLVAVFFFIYLINTAFPFYGGSVINVYMANEFGFSRTVLGSAVTAFVMSIGIVAPLVGFLVVRLGVKRIILFGGFLLITSTILMSSVVNNPQLFILVFGVLMGIGGGFGSMIPIQTGLTLWFSRRRAFAMSIVMCAAGVGAMIVTTLVQTLVKYTGGDWRQAWLVISVFLVMSWLVAARFIINKPEDIGQTVDGETAESEEKAAAHKTGTYKTDHDWQVKEALATTSFWLIVSAGVAGILVFNMVVAHGVLQLQDRSIDADLAALSAGMLVFFSIIGRLTAGILGDRYEIRYIWSFSLICCIVGLYTLMSAANELDVFIYALITGFGFGSCYVCAPALIGNYYGQQAFGPLFGIASSFIAILGATSPLLAGITHDKTGSYDLAIYTISCFLLIAALGILLAKAPHPETKAITLEQAH